MELVSTGTFAAVAYSVVEGSVCKHRDTVPKFPNLRATGEAEGDYVAPKLVALKKTCVACPSQWEGTFEDGRVVYARYRHGHLSVGFGDDIEVAVRNSMSDRAPYADYVGDGLDGFMDFEELKVHLNGLLDFPANLVVENERQPPPDPEALEQLFQPPRGD